MRSRLLLQSPSPLLKDRAALVSQPLLCDGRCLYRIGHIDTALHLWKCIFLPKEALTCGELLPGEVGWVMCDPGNETLNADGTPAGGRRSQQTKKRAGRKLLQDDDNDDY
eukprot:337832-Rhodomonas_salina.1